MASLVSVKAVDGRPSPTMAIKCRGARSLRSAVLLAALLLASAISPVLGAEAVTFRIHDHRDPAEIDEVTGVYVDGREVATFRLGPDRADDMATVSVTGPDGHTYALCGRVTVRREDGSAVTREVNGAGRISDVTDRDFDAIAAADFTIFYLSVGPRSS